jgi:hypothetical protein
VHCVISVCLDSFDGERGAWRYQVITGHEVDYEEEEEATAEGPTRARSSATTASRRLR